MSDVYDRKEVIVERDNGVNTILAVLLILVLAGLVVWFVAGNRGRDAAPQKADDNFNINVDLPDMSGDGSPEDGGASGSGNTNSGSTSGSGSLNSSAQ